MKYSLYLVFLYFINGIYDKEIITHITFHYSHIDFLYFLFLAIQYYWCYQLYHTIYQYLSLYSFLCIRIKKKQYYKILCWQFIKYMLIYILVHSLYFWNLPIIMFYNLIIQFIALLVTFKTLSKSEYSFMVMFIIIVVLHIF